MAKGKRVAVLYHSSETLQQAERLEELREQLEQLEYAKAKILGFVLNSVDMEKTNYGYRKYRYRRYSRYKKYGYGYGYGGYGGYGYGYGYSSRPQMPLEDVREQDET